MYSTVMEQERRWRSITLLAGSLFLAGVTLGKDLAGKRVVQQQYEWVFGQRVLQYAQQDSFSLLRFQVPSQVLRVDFEVSFSAAKGINQPVKTVVIALRRAGIPVVHLYDEAVPGQFTLPSDQQTHNITTSEKTWVLTLKSPAPGPVYLLASVINPMEDVVQALRWGKPLGGDYIMDVRAVYTVLTGIVPLDTRGINSHILTKGETVTYSLTVPAFAMEYELAVNNCTADTGDSCPVIMSVSDTLSGDGSVSASVNCSAHAQPCHLRVVSPTTDGDSYVTFLFDNTTGMENVTFTIDYKFQDCQTEGTTYDLHSMMLTFGNDVESAANGWHKRTARDNSTRFSLGLGPDDDYRACLNVGRLGRISTPTSEDFAFDVDFALWSVDGTVQPIVVMVPDDATHVRTLTLQETVDTGGMLYVQLQLMTEEVPKWRGTVHLCTMPRRLPYNSSLDNCPDGLHLAVNDSYVSTSSFLPFPSTGVWYLALRSQCFADGRPELCSIVPMVNVSLKLTQCSFGQCGQFGQCQLFSEATTVFSACVCQAGYRGMTCSDATYGLSKGEQLQAVYLLTLSNLFFLPAILLALHRRFFTLAAIFTFTFFFSTFYHACDTNRVYGLCITDYDTLSFCDFLGSVLSFWALLVTMGRLSDTWRTLLLMCGALVVAAVQSEEDERHDTVAHVVLVAVAGLVLVVSWGLEMRRRRSLFPSWRRYVFCLLPGALLALTGIVVNFTVTDMARYQYSHSFWHVAVMLAPCFLIPPRPKDLYGKDQMTSIQSVLSHNERPDAVPASRGSHVSERTPLITSARGSTGHSDVTVYG